MVSCYVSFGSVYCVGRGGICGGEGWEYLGFFCNFVRRLYMFFYKIFKNFIVLKV